MEPKIKDIEKWCRALRSGKYKQTRGALQNPDGYCCLGVACKVFIPRGQQQTDGYYLKGVDPDGQRSAPNWLKNIVTDFYNKTDHSLVTLNDSVRMSFDEIADLLEMVYIHKILE